MRRVLVALASFVVSAAASAAQSTATFGVSATVTSGCGVVATPVAFGTYLGTAASPAVDALGSVVVTCPAGKTYDVRLNNGANASGGQRRMRVVLGPASFLNYELYRNPARTQRFGNSGPERVNGVGSGLPQTIPVYARLPGAQVAPLGIHLDTIQVTLQF